MYDNIECEGNGTQGPGPPMTVDRNGWVRSSVPSTFTVWFGVE